MHTKLNRRGIVYLPKTLNDHIKSLPNKKGIDKSFLSYILHLILKEQTKRKFNANMWVNISSKTLKRYEFIANNTLYGYKKHLDYLEDCRVIERSKSYSIINEIAKGHRVNNSLFRITDELTQVTLTPRLALKVDSLYNKRKIKAKRSTSHLTNWLDSNTFTIDSDTALLYTNTKYAVQPDKRMARVREILEFDNIQYSREGKDGRLHTNLTRLPSDLREFVTYEGNQLYTLDLPNSQPLMLSILIDAFLNELSIEVSKEKPSINYLARRINKVIKKYCYITGIPKTNNVITNSNKISYALSSIMFPKETKNIDYETISKFKTLARTKKLYEYVGQELLDRGIIKQKGSMYEVLLTDEVLKQPSVQSYDSLKECGKKITFYALYSSIRNSNKAIKAFKALFPGVFKIVDVMKGEESGGYRSFSSLLQNMESKFILDYSTKRIANKYPMMPLVTIHDSVATTKEYISTLKHEFEIDFYKHFEIKINTTIESWRK
ncbi:hypothetical protein [Flavobacterium sp. C4GT6]|uniref:hypothetical protein n=1 Tax=Flavobacterium sp. C4GT6 TaxID=3103818 RepID=UPI002ED327EF